MSVETWMKEYYDDVTGAETWTDLKCFFHTRTKYTGARKENIEKHGVADESLDGFSFGFNSNTCSLCVRYDLNCNACPISDSSLRCTVNDSAFDKFLCCDDPEPMIALMDELIARCDENGKYIPKDGKE